MTWQTLKDLGLEKEKEDEIRAKGLNEIVDIMHKGKITINDLPRAICVDEDGIFGFDYSEYDKQNPMKLVSYSVLAIKMHFYNLEDMRNGKL